MCLWHTVALLPTLKTKTENVSVQHLGAQKHVHFRHTLLNTDQ